MPNNDHTPIDKRLVAERFARARNTYSRAARVQQQVTEKMLRLLARYADAGMHFRRIVEFGCGTGSYSRLLQSLQPETLLLNDLCPEMEACVAELCNPPAVRFEAGDAEALCFPQDSELITSCSTLQWFNEPEAFFLRCRRALAANGVLAFSTFGKKNLQQIRQLTGNGLHYLDIGQLQALLSQHFNILHAEEEIVDLPFPTPLHVLKHLKETGVTGTEKRMWTRTRLQNFCDSYVSQFSRTDGQVPLTYHPIYIIAQKK